MAVVKLPNEAQTFFETLHGNVGLYQEIHDCGDLFGYIWTLPDKTTYWFKAGDIAAAVKLAMGQKGKNVYFPVGLQSKKLGPHQRGNAEDVTALIGFWADLDVKSEHHKKGNLPPTKRDALKILAELPTPTLLWDSGYGIQALWLFDEPWVFDGDREQGMELAARWVWSVIREANKYGWTVDPVTDISRVLRVPGTFNCKGKPVPVKLLKSDGPTYSPEDLEPYMVAEIREMWGRVDFSGIEVELDPDAEPPLEKTKELRAKSTKFKNTMDFNRPEFNGDFSAYDMALANMAVMAGWTNQEIADLIVAVRRTHGDNKDFEKALRPDYIPRTIARAREDIKESRTQSIFFDGKKFIPKRLGEWLIQGKNVFVMADRIYAYKDGVYQAADDLFKKQAAEALDEEYKKGRVDEAISWILYTQQKKTPDEVVNTAEWLNVKNGLLNLKTGEFRPHTPELITTIQLPVEYNPKARCPAIKEFMQRVLPEDCIELITEFIGYILTPSMRFEKAMLFEGSGGNGKGTLISVITEMLGAGNVSSVGLQQLVENRFASAQLFGKMLNAHADIPPRYIQDSSRFKELVSGDLIYAEEKFKDGFQFRNRAKLLFSMNELPATSDTTEAFFRRLLIVRFPNKFHNHELRQRLFQPEELSGLLNLALEGLQRLEARGHFDTPDSVKEALAEYRQHTDSVQMFIDECCERGSKEYRIKKKRLFNVYDHTVRSWGAMPVKMTKFYKRIKMLEGVSERRLDNGREWVGIKLKPEYDTFPNY